MSTETALIPGKGVRVADMLDIRITPPEQDQRTDYRRFIVSTAIAVLAIIFLTASMVWMVTQNPWDSGCERTVGAVNLGTGEAEDVTACGVFR